MANTITNDRLQTFYIAYFGRAADTLGLSYWSNIANGAVSAGGLAGNESAVVQNLGAATQTEFITVYGSNPSTATFLNSVYTNLFGRAIDVSGLNYWAGVYNNLIIGGSSANAARSAIVTYIVDGALGTDAAAITAKVGFATSFTAALDTVLEITAFGNLNNTAGLATARTAMAGVTDATTQATATANINTTTASIVTSEAAIPAASSQTFTLTTASNTVAGGAAGDTIDGGTADSWSAFDSIDGGAGTDTMTATISGTAVPGQATIKNVETLNLNTTGAGFTIDTTSFTGLTSLKLADSAAGAISVTGPTTLTANISGTGASAVTVIGTGGDLKVSTGAAAVTVGATAIAASLSSASVTGGSTVAITDRSGTAAGTGSTLKTVTVTGNASSDDITITANGLTTLNLATLKGADTAGDTTITAAAGTRALTLDLSGVDTAADGAASAGGFTVTDAEATGLNIKATSAATYDVTTVTAKATAVTIDAAVALQLDALTAGVATTVGISGAGKATITADTLSASVVITSTSTGGVVLTQALTADQQFVGTSSTGADSVSVVATTKAITTGAGDDTVTVVGVSALGTGGSIDAGDGTGDTIKFSTYANAVTATGSTTFAGTVSNFEKLELSGVNAAAAAAINLANLDNINHVTMSATNTETTTVSNMGANGTIVFKADQTTGKPVTVSLTNAIGTTDVLNVGLSKATATALVGLTVAGVETVNVTSTETATTLLGTVTHGVEAFDLADTTTLNISGNAGVTITTLTGTKFTTIDASGVTTGLVSFTTGALASAATIKGGAGANTIVATAATKAVTYTGQEKVDTITINNALSNSVTTGGGDDVIVVGSGANTVNAGAGVDSITVGAGLNVVTGGAGVDTLIISTRGANGNTYSTFADAAVGDKIDLSALTVVARADAALGAKISLADTAAFADYLAAGTATIIADAAASTIKWFQYAGNTYIIVDDTVAANTPDDTNAFENGTDSVVKLTGLIDLSTSTTASDVLTIVTV